MLKKVIFLVLLISLALTLTSCSTGINNVANEGTKIDNTVPVSKVNEQATQKPTFEKSNDSDSKQNGNNLVHSNGRTYEITKEIYTDKDVTINYPQIINLTDSSKQNKVNEVLKSEALSALGFYEDANGVSLKINYKITWESKNILSLQYYGVGNAKGAVQPLDLLYTVNINMNKGCKLQLRDYIYIDKNFVNKFRKYKVKEPDINQASAGAFDYIMKAYSVEDLLRYFDGADSSYKNSAFTFSYFTKDALGISIEVPNVIGGHTEIELKYQDIMSNINTENDIWVDFPKYSLTGTTKK